MANVLESLIFSKKTSGSFLLPSDANKTPYSFSKITLGGVFINNKKEMVIDFRLRPLGREVVQTN